MTCGHEVSSSSEVTGERNGSETSLPAENNRVLPARINLDERELFKSIIKVYPIRRTNSVYIEVVHARSIRHSLRTWPKWDARDATYFESLG